MIVNTAPSDGGVTGNIYYKKNFLTNSLQIRGVLTANNAQNFAGSPTSLYSIMGILPTTYWPVSLEVPFIATYAFSNLIKDDVGVAWIKQINGALNNAGQIGINWLRPDVAIADYIIQFNVILPLD